MLQHDAAVSCAEKAAPSGVLMPHPSMPTRARGAIANMFGHRLNSLATTRLSDSPACLSLYMPFGRTNLKLGHSALRE